MDIHGYGTLVQSRKSYTRTSSYIIVRSDVVGLGYTGSGDGSSVQFARKYSIRTSFLTDARTNAVIGISQISTDMVPWNRAGKVLLETHPVLMLG